MRSPGSIEMYRDVPVCVGQVCDIGLPLKAAMKDLGRGQQESGENPLMTWEVWIDLIYVENRL